MMRFFTAQVRGGRLTLDEPTHLPDGALLELVSTEDILRSGGDLLDAHERAELARELQASLAEVEAGETIDLALVIAELGARH
jgi:hypothetical protein